MIQILLTGFEPFGDNEVNPTEVVVNSFDLFELDSLPQEILLDRVVLPVDTSAPDVLDDLLRETKYDIVVHLGLHEKAEGLKIETQGKNILDFRIPDNKGEQIKGKSIIEDAPEHLPSTFPVKAIERFLTDAGLPVSTSDDAGGYLCNMLLYRSLHFDRLGDRKALIGFVHVPPLKVLDETQLTRGVVAVLTACVMSVPSDKTG